MPECSIVIPSFNAEAYLVDALESVLNQRTTFLYEVIIVNDGSTDRTLNLLESYEGRVRVISKINGGPSSSRNCGVKNALSDIILFLDADDRMLPGRIDFQGKYLLSNPDVGLAWGLVDYESNPNANDIDQFPFLPNNIEFTVVEDAYRLLLEEGMFVRYANGVRRNAFLESGGQPTHICVAEDYAMCMNIARTHKIAFSNRKLNWYRQTHGGNLMSSPAAYYGPPRALADELVRIAGIPNLSNTCHNASRRLQKLCNMLFRHDWLNGNRQALWHHLKEFSALVPVWLVLKWKFIWLFAPSSIGRFSRGVKRRFVSKL